MALYRTKKPWLRTTKDPEGYKRNPPVLPMTVLIPADTEVEFDGRPSDNLEPIDGAAKRAVEEANEQRKVEAREAALKSSKEGSAILAALVTALQGSKAEGERMVERLEGSGGGGTDPRRAPVNDPGERIQPQNSPLKPGPGGRR